MKKSINPALFFVIINESCDSAAAPVKNIGRKKQCLEAPIQSYILAKDGFEFETLADAKDKAQWEAAIQNGDIVPFPDIEEIEDNSTDAEVYEGRFADTTLKAPVAGSDYQLNLSICTYAAAVSYENSEYTRMFQVTTDNEVTGEITDEGAFRGRKLSSFLVGNRMEATDTDPPNAHVMTKYASRFFSILKVGFDLFELEGVSDVTFNIQTASATEIEVTVRAVCGSGISSIDPDDILILDENGDDAGGTVSGPDPDGVYTISGTGFANGYQITLGGVVGEAGELYATAEPTIVNGI